MYHSLSLSLSNDRGRDGRSAYRTSFHSSLIGVKEAYGFALSSLEIGAGGGVNRRFFCFSGAHDVQTNSFIFLFIYHNPGFVSVYAHTQYLFLNPLGMPGKKLRISANQTIQKKIVKT